MIALAAAVLAAATAVTVLANTVVTWSTRRQVRQVHVMVNSQREAMEQRLEQLTEALHRSDTEVPPEPSKGERYE